MPWMRSKVALLMLLSCNFASSEGQPSSARGSITYDGQCYKIDGKPTFIYSGAFHYFRCPKSLWRDRFRKIKEAGFNAVETYIAWNVHETTEPASLDDYSHVDLKDADEWLTMAEEEFGLYTIVRPGPYICAEWDGGGFPQWLALKRPATLPADKKWLRTDDPTFLAWSRHWLTPVCKMVAPHQVTHRPAGKPGVILFQLENEYDYFHFPDKGKVAHLHSLAQDARDGGIDVPLFTCWTKQVRGSKDPLLSQVIDACNFYPGFDVDSTSGPLRSLRVQQPQAPMMVTELQGGWFSNVGGKLSEDQGLNAAQITNVTLFAWQHGVTLSNYYMLFGGTNFGDRAARTITTTYDYNAPIREWGSGGPRFQAVQQVGAMLKEIGPELAVAKASDAQTTSSNPKVQVAVRGNASGPWFVFVRNSDHETSAAADVQVHGAGAAKPWMQHVKLAPFEARVVKLRSWDEGGTWYPKAAGAPEPAREQQQVKPTRIVSRAEPLDGAWSALQAGTDLVHAGAMTCDFAFYRVRARATAEQLRKFPELAVLIVGEKGDEPVLFANGKVIPSRNNDGSVYSWSAADFMTPDHDNELTILYENQGHPNGGNLVDHAVGIGSVRLQEASTSATGELHWKSHQVDGVENRPEVQPGYDDSGWKTGESQDKPGEIRVYRTTVQLGGADIPQIRKIRFSTIDDEGWVFVNGKQVGESHDWSRPFEFECSSALHVGSNGIAVVVKNNEGKGGLRGASYLMGESLPGIDFREWQCRTKPAGLEHGYVGSKADESGWQQYSLGEAEENSSASSLLTWCRVHFDMPAAGAAPWRAHIEANGNGFLYLNGQPLGRYWQVGPQHDFYMPECWLHAGDNVLTIAQRPIDGSAQLRRVDFAAYP
jgi:hypothetical protein